MFSLKPIFINIEVNTMDIILDPGLLFSSHPVHLITFSNVDITVYLNDKCMALKHDYI